MTSEWLRDSITTLIALYKKEKFLYDIKSPLYYNRHARNRGLTKIVAGLQGLFTEIFVCTQIIVYLFPDERPGTTVNEVLKKIQTLRTQFGQELAKIKRSQASGLEQEFTYQPTVWWYEDMSFIKNFIKSRRDDGYNSKGKIEIKKNKSEIEYSDKEYEEDEETSASLVKRRHDEEQPQDENLEYSSPGMVEESSHPIKIGKYENQDTPTSQRSVNQKIEVIDVDENYMLKNEKTQRHEEIGRFVSSQMATIKDDLLFYRTQHEVLSIINKAQLCQLETNIANGIQNI